MFCRCRFMRTFVCVSTALQNFSCPMWKNAFLMRPGPNVYVRLWPHSFTAVYTWVSGENAITGCWINFCLLLSANWADWVPFAQWQQMRTVQRLFHHFHCYAAFCCQRTSLPGLNYLLRCECGAQFFCFVYQFNAYARDWWANSHAGHAVTAWFVNYAWLRNQRAILQFPGNLINPCFPFVFI